MQPAGSSSSSTVNLRPIGSNLSQTMRPVVRPTSSTVKPHKPPIYILEKCLSSGANLAACLSESQLYGQLFQEMHTGGTTQTEADETDLDNDYTSDYNHISGIPIDPNGYFINSILELDNNSTHINTIIEDTYQKTTPITEHSGDEQSTGYTTSSAIPTLVSELPVSDLTQQQLSQIAEQLLGTFIDYPKQNSSFSSTSGLFAVGHSIFDKLSNATSSTTEKQSVVESFYVTSKPLRPRPWLSAHIQDTQINVHESSSMSPISQASLLTLENFVHLTKPPETRPPNPVITTALLSTTSVVNSHPSYPSVPSLTDANIQPSYTNINHSSISQFAASLLGFGSSVQNELVSPTPSTHIQLLAKKHPHAHVIIGPPPKHLLQRTRINNNRLPFTRRKG